MTRLGKGTICRTAMLPLGVTTLPATSTITTGATVTAKTSTPGSITVLALAAGTNIPAGSFLGFVAPTTGQVVVVQLAADAVAAATTLSVTAVPEAIAASSTCAYPLRLSGRTAANIGRDGNRASVFDFDSDGFETGLTSSISQTIEFSGNYVPTDAGFLTVEQSFREQREIFFEIELVRISAAYSKGKVYRGRGSITAMPMDIPADGLITGNISVAVNGPMTIVLDVPT